MFFAKVLFSDLKFAFGTANSTTLCHILYGTVQELSFHSDEILLIGGFEDGYNFTGSVLSFEPDSGVIKQWRGGNLQRLNGPVLAGSWRGRILVVQWPSGENEVYNPATGRKEWQNKRKHQTGSLKTNKLLVNVNTPPVLSLFVDCSCSKNCS